MYLEILYASLSLFCSVKEEKKQHFSWNEWRMKGALRGTGSHFGCISVELHAWNLLIKQSSLVDNIIELCVKRSRDSGSVVAVLSPNKKLLSSVFIYVKVSQD